jgi:hypothetical protein
LIIFEHKIKTINPSLLADIAVYSCGIPILVFLLLPRNFQDRIKWVCFILIVSSFLFDLVSDYAAKKPISLGIVQKSFSKNATNEVVLNVTSGKVHEGVYLKADSFAGIVTRIIDKKSADSHIVVEVESISKGHPIPNSAFKAFSNIKIVNLNLLVELILTFFLFYLIFGSFPLWGKLAISALALSIILWILRNIILDGLYSYGGYYNGGTSILIIVFALAFFYLILNRSNTLFIYSLPAFWIVSALLIYKAATFFLFLYVNTLNQEEKANFYIINSGFNILKNLFYSIAFLLSDRRSNHLKVE